MARSRYIYLALVNGQPLAAFTVKHELTGWLRNWIRDAPEPYRSGLRLWRLTDAWITTPEPLTVDGLLRPEGAE